MPVPSNPFAPPMVSGGTRVPVSAASLVALAALALANGACTQGNEVFVDADGSRWVYNSTSTLAGDNLFVVAPSDGRATGRWLRMVGMVDLKIPIDFTLADAAVLATIPAGARLSVRRAYWEVTTGFSGGSSSAIGISSSQSPHNTKGDILGGATGDVAATLVAGVDEGTIGADIAAGAILIPAATLRFDRITSAFTAGAGYVHIVGDLLLNAGA